MKRKSIFSIFKKAKNRIKDFVHERSHGLRSFAEGFCTGGAIVSFLGAVLTFGAGGLCWPIIPFAVSAVAFFAGGVACTEKPGFVADHSTFIKGIGAAVATAIVIYLGDALISQHQNENIFQPASKAKLIQAFNQKARSLKDGFTYKGVTYKAPEL